MKRKVIFDAVRRMLGRGFTQREVAALDAAVDAATVGQEVFSQDSGPSGPRVAQERRTVGLGGLALIREFEGCARLRADGLYEAYPDAGTGGAPWTIGWGATGPDIGPETVWTRQECDARLVADVARHAAQVAAALGAAPTSANQFDALVSFHYNTGAIGRATLTRKHIAGHFSGASREFARWNRAGGRILPGLSRRRAAEARLYRG